MREDEGFQLETLARQGDCPSVLRETIPDADHVLHGLRGGPPRGDRRLAGRPHRRPLGRAAPAGSTVRWSTREASVTAPIRATLHTDPGCPWAYSALPALRVLDWRYGDQIALAARGDRPRRERRGLPRARLHARPAMLGGHVEFRDRFGMPFASLLKERVSGTARACRAIVAARLIRAGQRVGRAQGPPARQLHHAPAAGRRRAAPRRARRRGGRRRRRRRRPAGRPRGDGAYERDRAEARTAAGSAAAAPGQDGQQRRRRCASPRPERGAGGRRPAPGRRRLADRRGLRRPGGEPRPRPAPRAAARRPRGRSCAATPRGWSPRRSRRC